MVGPACPRECCGDEIGGKCMECDPFAAPPSPRPGQPRAWPPCRANAPPAPSRPVGCGDRMRPRECEVVVSPPISRDALRASERLVCPGQWPFSARYFCAADFVPFEAFGRQKLKTFLPSRGPIHAGNGRAMLIVTS